MTIKYDREKVRNEIFREIYESEHELVSSMNSEIVDSEMNNFEKLFKDTENHSEFLAGFIISNYVDYCKQLQISE